MISLLVFWRGLQTFLKINWKWLLIAVVVIFAYFKLTGMWSDYKEAVDEKARVVRELSLDKQAAVVESERARAALAQAETTRDMLNRLLEEARAEKLEIASSAKAQLDAFTKADGTRHDLQGAADRHGEWVGKLATKASNTIIKETEDEINN